MIGKNRSIDMMFKNLKSFEQNIGFLVNKSNESRLSYSLSFKQVSHILGFLTMSQTGYKKDIIEILTVIIDNGKFSEKKYQDLFMKVIEYFEDEEFRLLCN